jgi:hypothetical protein
MCFRASDAHSGRNQKYSQSPASFQREHIIFHYIL